VVVVGLLTWGGRAHAAPAARASSPCVADEPVPTPKDYFGWERSGRVAWKAIEEYGGIVPEIEEDRRHAPPAWWRYPSPLRSAEILAAEASSPGGLYRTVAPADIKQGDILVRAHGAGSCGKMAILGGQVNDQWMTLEAGQDDSAMLTGNPLFFAEGGTKLRDDVAAFRIQVKKDETLGHVRELRRDLTHLERTVGERPVLVAKNGRAVVDEKVHDLIDEAWSLVADTQFDLDRRELTGRALALGAALDWPGAGPLAAAVLDDVLRRAPARPEALTARAAVHLLAGQSDKAVTAAEAAVLAPGAPARAHYVLGRSLIAAGKTDAGLAAIKIYLDSDPLDPRATRLMSSLGAEPKLAPPDGAEDSDELRLGGGPQHADADSVAFGFHVEWPLTWRVVGVSPAAGTGMMLSLSTGRVILDDGDTERGSASLLVQRPDTAAERSALVKKAGKNIFPDAKLRSLPPLIPGSKREQFRAKEDDAVRSGEVTTIERGGTVYFLVLSSSLEAYGKLKTEYAALVKSLALKAAAAGTPAPAAAK
jgi:tetratricopeptide (TPR) repeat protein